jgi:hypothetical protein
MRKAMGIYTDCEPKSRTNTFDDQSNQNPSKTENAPPKEPESQRSANVRLLLLHAVPEVVRIEEAIELWIQVDNIDASLCRIPNNSTRKVASVVVLFSIYAQTAVNTKFQSNHSVSFLS